jgi:hypothetical protein
MRKVISALAILALWTLAGMGSVAAANYVDTSGNIIREDLSETCRPTWTLDNGDLMVFSTSVSDVDLLKQKLIESGMTDQARLHRWIRSAQSNDCTSRAGLNCSAGTCSSGSCQSDTNKNGTACLCK